jgi:hypothetical protein
MDKIFEKLKRLQEEEVISIAATLPDLCSLFSAIRERNPKGRKPGLEGTLIDAGNLDAIAQSARHLRNCPYSLCAFECVLDPGLNNADFSFSLGRIVAEAAIRYGTPISDWLGGTENREKDRILRFLARWLDKKSLLYHSIYTIYLELDTSVKDRAGIPGIFVRLQSGNKRAEWYETISLAVLDSLGIEPTSGKRRFISDFYKSFVDDAEFHQLGVMFSRDDFPMKLIALGADQRSAKQILGSLGFDMSKYISDADWDMIAELSEGVVNLSLDFIDKGDNAEWARSRIGIELPSSANDNKLIDWLVGKGCCSVEKGEVLRNWKRDFPYFNSVSGKTITICQRTSHYKLVLQPDLPVKAKAYIGFFANPL